MTTTTLGGLVDILLCKKERISSLKKEIKVLEAEMGEIKEQVFTKLSETKQQMAAGFFGKVQAKYKIIPIVKSGQWDLFYSYIKEKDLMFLLQKRLSESAVLQMLEEDVEVPAVEIFKRPFLSISKL